jgi:hypothetical protein
MVTVPDANTLDLTSAMTLEAWVRPTAQSDWRTAVLKETSGDLVYALYSSSAYGGVGAARPSSWIAAQNVGSTTALPANAWSHVAVTYDRVNWRLYVNGTQVATRAYTAAIPTSTGALRIGGNSIWGEWFAGQIDDVRVYGRALSAGEVAADRDTGVGGGAPPPPDTTAPTATMTAPAAGSVSGTVTVSANASDDVGVSGVQFKLDGANLGSEDTTAPYSLTWDTRTAGNGPHTLTAVARDAAGNSGTATTVNVTVTNDVTAPAVSLTAPADGATVSGTIPVTANASDDTAVTGVQFKLDGANLGSEDTSAPYSVNWSTTTATSGPHTLTAVARDAAGNSRTSGAVAVTVANDSTAPTVSITNPADGATVSGSVGVTADAADAVGVAGVQFKLDGANLGSEDTSSPYSVSWNTTTASNGAHSLTAVARDAAGNSRTSGAVGVTVSNAAPPPPSGIVAAYAFDEAAGASVGDSSGKGNLGTISGATRTTAGKNGAALTFDGVNDMVTVPDAGTLDLTSAMTLEAWVRPTAQSDYRTAIIKETSGNLVYALYSSSAFGGSGVQRPSAWLGAQGLGATTALPVNAWTHIATTYDRVNWRLYVNGVQVATRAYTTAIATSTGALRIGGNSIWGEWFAGQIDDVRVYARALSAAEVAADRDSPVAP